MYYLNFDPGCALISCIFFRPSDSTNCLVNKMNYTFWLHYRLVKFFGIGEEHITRYPEVLPGHKFYLY